MLEVQLEVYRYGVGLTTLIFDTSAERAYGVIFLRLSIQPKWAARRESLWYTERICCGLLRESPFETKTPFAFRAWVRSQI